MKCADCKHWHHEAAEVVPGSRRLVSECMRPGGPVIEGGDMTIGRHTYDWWLQCVVGEAHGSAERNERLGRSAAAQNRALDKRYPP